MSKRYDVCAPRAKKDGGTFWHRVGTAFEGEKGISVLFDSLPLPDKEGRVSVSLFTPREKQETRERPADIKPPGGNGPQTPRRSSAEMDDEIPF